MCRVRQDEFGASVGHKYIIFLQPHRKTSIPILRNDVSYENVPFITPVHNGGLFDNYQVFSILTDQLVVEFEGEAKRQVNSFAKKHNLRLARKSESGICVAYRVPKADDIATLTKVSELQQYCGRNGIVAVSPNFQRLFVQKHKGLGI
jgi:hypothetical protein